MADDLGDEWWLDPNEREPEEAQEDAAVPRTKDQQTRNATKGGALPSNKRKSEGGEQDVGKAKKRKKKKKKTLSEHLASTDDKPGTGDDICVAMATYFHNKLSAIEMEELILEEHCFLDVNKGNESVSDYLNGTIPDWSAVVKKEQESKKPNKSCVLLLLTSSGKRAVDLMRDAASFRGKCVTAKLFAKHIKIAEQEKFLASHRVQFAVGTPHRVSCLLESGAVTLDDTKYVILDWNWRDAKLRRFVDIPELKRDLFELLRKHLIPAASRGKVKFGLL
ncbi:protein CMSS1-like [Diadema antillarum]|uniref:protein CMSS1-like n=1 Tax=Diadema antillarum TaxID=105358 RepID=UPI003A87EB27